MTNPQRDDEFKALLVIDGRQYLEYTRLSQELEASRKAWEIQWFEQNREQLARQAALKGVAEQYEERLKVYLLSISDETASRKLLEGRVKFSLRRRAGQYDTDAQEVREWASKMLPTAKKLPTEKSEKQNLFLQLFEHHPDWLSIDWGAVEKLAIDVYESDNPTSPNRAVRVYPDAPIPIEWFVAFQSKLDDIVEDVLQAKETSE